MAVQMFELTSLKQSYNKNTLTNGAQTICHQHIDVLKQEAVLLNDQLNQQMKLINASGVNANKEAVNKMLFDLIYLRTEINKLETVLALEVRSRQNTQAARDGQLPTMTFAG